MIQLYINIDIYIHTHIYILFQIFFHSWLLQNIEYSSTLSSRCSVIYFIYTNCKKIQPVHSKGDQPWVFFGKNDAKAETPVLWPPHAKS